LVLDLQEDYWIGSFLVGPGRLRVLPTEPGRGKQFSGQEQENLISLGQSIMSSIMNGLDRVLLVP
jgi:hypothetical protein